MVAADGSRQWRTVMEDCGKRWQATMADGGDSGWRWWTVRVGGDQRQSVATSGWQQWLTTVDDGDWRRRTVTTVVADGSGLWRRLAVADGESW